MIKILKLTQVTIQDAILNLAHDENRGDPKNYDIMINRRGSGFDTEYVTQRIPPEPVDAKITAELEPVRHV